MTNWTYLGKQIKSIEDFPEDAYGFIYEITHDKKYIGKIRLWNRPKWKITKKERKELGLHGNVKWRKDEDGNIMRRKYEDKTWRTYKGSTDEFKDIPLDKLDRRILQLSFSSKEHTYLELKHIVLNDALLSSDYLNYNLLGKFQHHVGVDTFSVEETPIKPKYRAKCDQEPHIKAMDDDPMVAINKARKVYENCLKRLSKQLGKDFDNFSQARKEDDQKVIKLLNKKVDT